MRIRAALIGSLAIALSLSGTEASAQAIHPQSIEDQVLGWMKIYDYKGATLPIKMDQRVYSPAQLSIAQLFANWMQASYLPTDGREGGVVPQPANSSRLRRKRRRGGHRGPVPGRAGVPERVEVGGSAGFLER
ncbi:MAG: hypothetical protein ACYC99_08335 [Candidatus Geothermincolia bacterium]